jgi:hypothetical protein
MFYKLHCVRVLQGLALPRVSPSGDIAVTGSCGVTSPARARPFVTVAKLCQFLPL